MKRLASLFGRVLVAVTVASAALLLLSGVALFLNVVRPLAERSSDDLAALLVLSARTWVELPPGTRPALEAELATSHALELREVPAAATEEVFHHPYLNFLRVSLDERLAADPNVRLSENPDGRFHADVPMAGRILRFSFSKDLVTPRPLRALWWTAGAIALVAFVTAAFLARLVSEPVARLALAARRIGRGESPAPMPETGTRELAEVARAFNETAAQLAAQRENQATLLAGVSHDLRSPLARIRMAAGLLRETRDDPLLARLESDIDEMDRLIGAQLALVRAREPERQVRTDLDALLADRAAAARELAPGEVRFRAPGPPCRVDVAPVALGRIMSNVVENALVHARGGPVDIIRRRCGSAVFVGIRDRGPGIPGDLREAVMRPFYRLDASRSRSTGGFGLGLAIARQLADTHRWRLAVKSRRGGGTSVWPAIGPPTRP